MNITAGTGSIDSISQALHKILIDFLEKKFSQLSFYLFFATFRTTIFRTFCIISSFPSFFEVVGEDLEIKGEIFASINWSERSPGEVRLIRRRSLEKSPK